MIVDVSTRYLSRRRLSDKTTIGVGALRPMPDMPGKLCLPYIMAEQICLCIFIFCTGLLLIRRGAYKPISILAHARLLRDCLVKSGRQIMRAILGILGVPQIGGGILIYLFAKSEIREILGSVSFGMGVMAVGLSGVIALLEKQLAISTSQGSLKRDQVSDLPPIRHPSYFGFERDG
ncbi:hypothetical protein [Mesorhizobium sp. M1406]|uniref:hypothetical protein n=1 Tax=Mesorhizobium sp. M1406 TaxID=2957099 RepID=UPI0033357262